MILLDRTLAATRLKESIEDIQKSCPEIQTMSFKEGVEFATNKALSSLQAWFPEINAPVSESRKDVA